eukprot:TRINITY_DN1035_c0_g1_i4.p1 TRINITY_DN1035_c0_g1~~TRINITY_DN1035_c0_g1_i4.p1  ORF type:complete len:348 (-),score=78.86 TRINITY_DN1035_c0_g1_i4:109-1152(-)
MPVNKPNEPFEEEKQLSHPPLVKKFTKPAEELHDLTKGIPKEFSLDQIKITFAAGKLSKESILGILTGLEFFVKDDFIRMTLQNREERRAYLHTNEKKYRNLCIDILESFDELINKTMEDLLAKLGISMQQFEDSFGFWVESGSQELIMQQMTILPKLKEAIPAQREVKYDEFVEALQFSLDKLNEEMANFDFSQMMMDPNAMRNEPHVLQSKVYDIVYEKYGIEEEDILGNLRANGWDKDPKIRKLMEDTARTQMSLMPMDPAMMMGMGGMSMEDEGDFGGPMGGMGGMPPFMRQIDSKLCEQLILQIHALGSLQTYETQNRTPSRSSPILQPFAFFRHISFLYRE